MLQAIRAGWAKSFLCLRINMRVGGFDARIFRRDGIPTTVYGTTPFNMGGADENVLVEELGLGARVHALTSFNYLVI